MMFKNYKLRRFTVTELSSGMNGQAQFFQDPGNYEINIKMDDGREILSHLDSLNVEFAYYYAEFSDAKAEKILFDRGYCDDK